MCLTIAMTELYHATSAENAQSIREENELRPGSHGFVGGAIYFSEDPDAAIRKCHGGRGQPDVLIQCLVDLGQLIEVPRDMYDIQDLLDMGYDSAKVIGVDVFAVYDPERVQILQFHGLNAFSNNEESESSGENSEYGSHPGYGSEDDYSDGLGSEYCHGYSDYGSDSD